ncbi:MAG TPA: sialate O-acetylesterase [Pseudoxanthomonas sp.]
MSDPIITGEKLSEKPVLSSAKGAELYGIKGGQDYRVIVGSAGGVAEHDRLVAVELAQTSGAIGYATKANMDADLAHDAGALALVTNDPTAENNGTYRKTGASGAGSWVPSADRVTALEADVAELKDDTALLVSLDAPVRQTNRQGFQYADPDGNALVDIEGPFAVGADGEVETSAIATHARDMNSDFAVADADGNIGLRVVGGKLDADFSLIPKDYDTSGTYDYEVNHLFVYGQSLSVGQATPAISTTQRYDNLMFTRGMRPQYDYPLETAAQWYAGLVPAVEAASTQNVLLAETPCMGAGDAVKELILAEAGLAHTDLSYQMLLSAPGYGARTIAQLSKGSAHFSRMVEQSTYGLSLSNAAGKSYAVQAVAWIQGESDYLSATTQAAYEGSLGTLVSDINADLKAATGQTKSIPVIGYQVASHKVNGVATPNIALAQLSVEASDPLFYIACPMYQFEYQDSSNNHLTPLSSRLLGAYIGLAYKRIVIDGIAWRPLRPLSAARLGSAATVEFHVPHGRLVFDTDAVDANTNYGFELVDSGGTPLTISSVAIISPTKVKITAASTIPAGAKVRYAWSGSGNVGKHVGPRGNLRDTQGDRIRFDRNGINTPMHNWAVIFEMGV